MEEQKITPHFCLSEFQASATARRHGIDNTIPRHLLPNIRALCQHVLEPLRQHFGQPVVISSGYRSPTLNRLVGGVATSQHLTGQAADIRAPDVATLHRWFLWLQRNVPYDQLIWEGSCKSRDQPTSPWIHVSYRPDARNRHQLLVI